MSFSLFKQPFLRKPFHIRGFSLPELMVTIAIFTIITSVILTNSQQFNGGIVLSNLAYEVALTIRQAQVYGLGIRATSGGSFTSPYGVYASVANGKKQFIFFTDTNKDKKFTDGTEAVEIIDIKQGNEIERLCVYDGPLATEFCNDFSGGFATFDAVSIRFLRPNPDALFSAFSGGSEVFTSGGASTISSVKIVVWSPQTGKKRAIEIRNTGQISVETQP